MAEKEKKPVNKKKKNKSRKHVPLPSGTKSPISAETSASTSSSTDSIYSMDNSISDASGISTEVPATEKVKLILTLTYFNVFLFQLVGYGGLI